MSIPEQSFPTLKFVLEALGEARAFGGFLILFSFLLPLALPVS